MGLVLMTRLVSSLLVVVLLVGAAGCSAPEALSAADDRVQVVTTTGILRDLVENVGGDRVVVSSLVPDGGDPHSHEPSLREVRNVVYADVAFSNYAFLEQHAIIRALDANLPDGVPNVEVAEGAIKYAAEIIPLVEDVSLDTVWLGMRVRGTGQELGADRSSEVRLAATGVAGPGEMTAFLTESFGNPEVYVRSADGFDDSDGYAADTAVLPPDAHTHMSWVFTEPGVYTLDLAARLAVARGERPVPVAEGTVTFAVGVNPRTVPGMDVAHVLSEGHADIAVDLDAGALQLVADRHGGGEATQHTYDPATTVVEVPTKALAEVPGDPTFRFLGDAGDPVYQLPQAVLGKHVHGEIDPHLWQDVGNAISYVQLIRDTLVGVDPAGARAYHRNAEAYVDELEGLDDEVRDTIAAIPEAARHLVTTHDAFAYLGQAYDIAISGFVTPNPSAEPSLADRRRLQQTIRDLDVPAVFLEPTLASRSSTLREVAEDEDIAICPIYGDTFDREVTTYVEMMRANARSLHDCLTP
jgi:anchored repeat ABC transporter substrate-binding protein